MERGTPRATFPSAKGVNKIGGNLHEPETVCSGVCDSNNCVEYTHYHTAEINIAGFIVELSPYDCGNGDKNNKREKIHNTHCVEREMPC